MRRDPERTTSCGSWVREPARAGLREEVTAAAAERARGAHRPGVRRRRGTPRPSAAGAERHPAELFHEYLGCRSVADERVEALFGRLHDRVTGSG
jgi:exonuclease SbcD